MANLRVYIRARDADGYRSSNLVDITMLCGGIQLEGAVEAASRKLTLDVLRAGQDYYLSGVASIRRGDGIILDDGTDQYIFFGVIWRVEESDDSTMMTVTCYDNMKFLMTSDCITNVWSNVTPGEVTETVCKELGVTCEDLPACDLKVSVNARGKTGYEAIMIAWTEAHKQNGKIYYPRMVGYKLHIIEKGTKLEGHSLKHYSRDLAGSIIRVSLAESTETAVTSLWERNGAGTATCLEEDDALMKLYGYIVGMNEAGQAANQAEVKEINDGEKLASVEAIGDWQMQTGWSVPIESKLLTEELLYIESDVHYYENGIHTMELELSYENRMDEMENDPIEAAESGSVSGNTTEEKIWNFLRAQGFSAAAAAGIMGNMYGESRCVPDTNEVGGYGGYGLCQWTFSRKTDLMNWCANNGYDYTSLEGQLNFFMYEYELPYYSQFLGDSFKEISDVWTATDRFLTYFEGCTVRTEIVHWDVRLNAAQDYYGRWKDYVTIPASSGATGSTAGATGTAASEVLPVYEGLYGLAYPLPYAQNISAYTYYGHTNHARDFQPPTAKWGTPVVSVLDGVVKAAGDGVEHWTYGNSVYIDHGEGWMSRYAHLDSISVSVGQAVKKGQVIGGCGSTGTSSGLHLHMELHSPWGWVDPGPYYSQYGYVWLTGSE